MLDGPAGAIGRSAWAARVGGVLSSEGAACLLACLSSLFFCFEGGRAQAQRGIRPLGGSPACRFDQLVCGLVGSKSYGTYLARPLFPAFMPGISHGRVWYGMVWCGALLCGCSFMRFPAPAAFQRKKNRMSIQGWMGGWILFSMWECKQASSKTSRQSPSTWLGPYPHILKSQTWKNEGGVNGSYDKHMHVHVGWFVWFVFLARLLASIFCRRCKHKFGRSSIWLLERGAQTWGVSWVRVCDSIFWLN